MLPFSTCAIGTLKISAEHVLKAEEGKVEYTYPKVINIQMMTGLFNEGSKTQYM